MTGRTGKYKIAAVSAAVVVGWLLMVLICVWLQGLPSQRKGQLGRAEMMAVALLGLENDASFNHRRVPLTVHRDFFGKPLSSWRFWVLRYFQGARKDRFDRHWCDPEYFQIACAPMRFYCSNDKPSEKSPDTNIVAVTGPGTARACHLHDWQRTEKSDTVDMRNIFPGGLSP